MINDLMFRDSSRKDVAGNESFLNGRISNTRSSNANININFDGNTHGSGNCSILATNLLPNNVACAGIAIQSDLLDEVVANQMQQKINKMSKKYYQSFFSFGQNSNNNDTGADHAQDSSDDMVSSLTQKLRNLSVTERENAQSDMYGFRLKPPEHDLNQVQEQIKEVDNYIAKASAGNEEQFSSLRLVMHIDVPSERNRYGSNKYYGNGNSGALYIQSQRLKFLRASNWDPESTVVRMAKYLDLKLEYFGADSLARELTLQDLGETDLDLWRRLGFLQLSEEQDAYGRAILIFMGKEQCKVTPKTFLRVLIYMTTIMARDETIQINGTSQVYIGHGQNTFDKNRLQRILKSFHGFPIRGIARHICHDGVEINPFLEGVVKFSTRWSAIRFKLHHGTIVECVYNLLTYGIPREAIPINNSGEVDLRFHHSFLNAIEKEDAGDRVLRRQLPVEDIHQSQVEHQHQRQRNQAMASSSNNNVFNQQQMANSRGQPYQKEPPLPILEDGLWDISGLPETNLDLLVSSMGCLPEGDRENNYILGTNTNPNSATSNGRMVPLHTHSFSCETNLVTINGGGQFGQTDEPILTGIEQIQPSVTYSAADALRQGGNETNGYILVPGPFDVIMGRGRHNKKKPGNQRLNKLLAEHQADYEAGDKFQKTVLSQVLVKKMMEGGSRFIIRDSEVGNGLWVQVSLEKARDKVAHDFRNLRISAKGKAKDANKTGNRSKNNANSSQKRPRSVPSAGEEETGSKRSVF